MSYNQGGNYQQQQQQNQGYYDPNRPYGQTQQNAGQQAQYGQAPQYPGQPTYNQYGTGAGGGPVQQPQAGYQDGYPPQRQASYSQYPGQPSYSDQPYQYNPQHFAHTQPPVQQPTGSQYNPQSYASPTQAAFSPQQYNPQHFSPATSYGISTAFTSATSGPVDPYAYPEAVWSENTPRSPQRHNYSPAQSYSPAQQYASQPQQSPRPTDHYSSWQDPRGSAQQSHGAPYPRSDTRTHSHSVSFPNHSLSPPLPEDGHYSSPPSYDYPESRQSPSPLYPTASHGSLPSTPGIPPTPPGHGPARMGTVGRHPQARPLPGFPQTDAESDYFNGRRNEGTELTLEEQERLAQEDLFAQVESAAVNIGRTGGHSPAISVSQPPADGDASTPLYAPRSPNVQRNGSVSANGHLSATPYETQYSSDSDAEGTAGVHMLQMAEDEDRRRESGISQIGNSQIRISAGYGSQRSSRQQPLMPQPNASDSDDYGAVDMGSFGGGYDVGRMTYGGDPSVLAAGGDVNGYYPSSQPTSSQHSSLRRSNPSQSSQASRDYGYDMGYSHPFAPFNPNARVDVGGSGGLSQPTAQGRRQSYDEGDEDIFSDERFPDEPPDIFYQPASTSYRPLPAVPDGLYSIQTEMRQAQGGAPYPTAPDAFYTSHGTYRSTSLLSHTTQPQVHQPSRSKTDAEERRLRVSNRNSQLSTIESTPSLTPALDLPSIPGKRFIPSQLGAPAFSKCEEPWSLEGLLSWLLQITNPDQVTELRELEVKEALVALFTNKVPTMNIADAETLSNRVVMDMYDAGTLIVTEEWVRIVPGEMQGVIFQLTGTGCYAPTVHKDIIPGRCYSHHCQRTLKKVNLREQPVRTGESWAEFYHLKKEDYEGRDKRELERQHILHEIVQTEDGFMEQLNILRTLYRDGLASAQPSIITPKRQEQFLQSVFGKVDALKQANEDHLLPQLKYRQQEQGPWIKGFSDIFRQWIRKARTAYTEYAAGFPRATFLVRQEIERNIEFRNFIDRARNDKRSNRLGWDSFLKAPITRLQRYTLLLSTVLRTMKTDSEEKTNLKIAFDEVKNATLECDARVAEQQRKVDLSDLSLKLVLRANIKATVELNLDHYGRELFHRGDLQRMGDSRFTWLDSHALLFDHYLIIAKTSTQRTEQNGRIEKYDVSRMPIPMDLLILESTNDPPVQKGSYVKGLTRDVVGGRSGTPQEQAALGRTPSTQSFAPQLQHTNTGASANSLQTVTSLGENKDADKIMYPFKVKHLGRDTYTLFAPTEPARREWANKIIEAKTKHAAALYNQNSEPFKLRVMADSAFVHDGFVSSGSRVVIKGTPVDRAIKEVDLRFKDSGRPGPVCRARVNCATTFTTPGEVGKGMVAVGTDFGVYVSEVDNPRGWSKAIPMTRVTQLAVLEEFNVFLLISDKSLIAYPLDVVCPTGSTNANGPASHSSSASNDSALKAPRKLSGSRDVGFFVAGRMKDRTLVFYKKRENLNSVFKVIEPIYQKSTEKRRGFPGLKRGNTEFFREYDEFYIPADCYALNLFTSSLAVSTARGFEVLTLDKKVANSVPDLRAAEVQNIASHIKDQKALAMLRLSEQEFLLVFGNCAVYVNRHGEVSRSVILEFVGVANQAALWGSAPYLILFNEDFVEIRNAMNGRLKQIVPGREIKCLDDGGTWSYAQKSNLGGMMNGSGGGNVGGRTVKFVMQHPESDKVQVLVEMLGNENMKEQQ